MWAAREPAAGSKRKSLDKLSGTRLARHGTSSTDPSFRVPFRGRRARGKLFLRGSAVRSTFYELQPHLCFEWKAHTRVEPILCSCSCSAKSAKHGEGRGGQRKRWKGNENASAVDFGSFRCVYSCVRWKVLREEERVGLTICKPERKRNGKMLQNIDGETSKTLSQVAVQGAKMRCNRKQEGGGGGESNSLWHHARERGALGVRMQEGHIEDGEERRFRCLDMFSNLLQSQTRAACVRRMTGSRVGFGGMDRGSRVSR